MKRFLLVGCVIISSLSSALAAATMNNEVDGAPVEEDMYDLIVLGAGSGGMASARRAANLYKARVALVEASRLGGTCVNLGCVPKKVMYNAASVADRIRVARAYGFQVDPKPEFNWLEFKGKRDAYVQRLNGIYDVNLKKDDVAVYHGYGKLLDGETVQISGGNYEQPVTIKGRRIIVATGTHAFVPDIPGADLGITSDGFFGLEKQPKKVGIVGSGYVGVELAGVLHALGSEVQIWCRKDGVLSHFDEMISKTLTSEMERIGIKISKMAQVTGVSRGEDGRLKVCFQKDGGDHLCEGYDELIWAIGRGPNTKGIGLEAAGVKMDKHGHVIVDDYQNTSAESIYAVGDITGKFPLTPVAIAAGRRLIDRLFGAKSESRLIYENVPTVVFSHPTPCATIGLNEREARAEYGDAVKIYETKFVNMFNAPFEAHEKNVSRYKLICIGEEQRIVGLHMIGEGSDEILQGFGVAIKMGATKADFEQVLPIHPTAAEEVVNMR